MSFLPKAGTTWSIGDLKRLVELEIPESSTVEFKEALPLKQGASGWATKGKIHDSERDGIAKEIVAFANAYGGNIVVGIEESKDAPKRAKNLAKPMPNLPDLLDRLRAGLSSVINPPISGLRIEGILTNDDEAAGFIVITVPASSAAPHGVGRPPLTYIRRDERSDAATMQDLQSLFWDTRMKLQRIDQEIASFSKLSTIDPKWEANPCYRFYAIPEYKLNLFDIAGDMSSGRVLDPTINPREFQGASVVTIPKNIHEWRPTASGVDCVFVAGGHKAHGRWQISQSGTVSVEGNYQAYTPQISEISQVSPAWFAKGLGRLIGMAQVLSHKTGYESDWIVGFGICCDQAVHVIPRDDDFGEGRQVFSGSHASQPIRLSDFENVELLDRISHKVWETFHLIERDGQALSKGVREMAQFLGKPLK